MVCKFGPELGHVTQENEDILFKDAHSDEMKRVLLGVTEAEVGDVVMFAVADVGGELCGVETAPQLNP
jgi:hypothetical protein